MHENSNVLGTITPVAELIAIAHRHGVRILIDGALSVAHIPVNVTALDADFFVFSGHKIYALTGIGAIYGKKEVLEEAKPYHGGGNMIKDVTFEKTIYNPAPNKSSALSFVMDGISNDAVGQRLDQNGIAVRVGHHCAQPILRHYGLESVVCPTLALYNSFEDIDTLVKVLRSL